jgi:hypothetical protein
VKAKNGGVFYYRQGSSEQPTPEQLAIFKLVMAAKAPISLSTKADFSDYVGQDGKSHPRK